MFCAFKRKRCGLINKGQLLRRLPDLIPVPHVPAMFQNVFLSYRAKLILCKSRINNEKMSKNAGNK